MIKLILLYLFIAIIFSQNITYINNCNEISLIFGSNNYVLNSSLDCSNIPILVNNNEFRGVFDGRGFRISNVKIILKGVTVGGFITKYCNGCSIKNIIFDASQYDGESNEHCGFLVGYCYKCIIDNIIFDGIISNIYVNNTLKHVNNNDCAYYFSSYTININSTNFGLLAGLSEDCLYQNIVINNKYISHDITSSGISFLIGSSINSTLNNIVFSNNYFKSNTNNCCGILIGEIFDDVTVTSVTFNNNNYFIYNDTVNALDRNLALIGCNNYDYYKNILISNNHINYDISKLFGQMDSTRFIVDNIIFNHNLLYKTHYYNLFWMPTSLQSTLINNNKLNFEIAPNVTCLNKNVMIVTSNYSVSSSLSPCIKINYTFPFVTDKSINGILNYTIMNTLQLNNSLIFNDLLLGINTLACDDKQYSECIPCYFGNSLNSVMAIYEIIMLNSSQFIYIKNFIDLSKYFKVNCERDNFEQWNINLYNKNNNTYNNLSLFVDKNVKFNIDNYTFQQNVHINNNITLTMQRNDINKHVKFNYGLDNNGKLILLLEKNTLITDTFVFIETSNALQVIDSNIQLIIGVKIMIAKVDIDVYAESNFIMVRIKKKLSKWLIIMIILIPTIMILIVLTSCILYKKYMSKYAKNYYLNTILENK